MHGESNIILFWFSGVSLVLYDLPIVWPIHQLANEKTKPVSHYILEFCLVMLVEQEYYWDVIPDTVVFEMMQEDKYWICKLDQTWHQDVVRGIPI